MDNVLAQVVIDRTEGGDAVGLIYVTREANGAAISYLSSGAQPVLVGWQYSAPHGAEIAEINAIAFARSLADQIRTRLGVPLPACASVPAAVH